MAPTIVRAATFTSGTPVALATNGTVRLARGLASITNTWFAFTAYCTLMRPTTSSSVAMARVWPSITAMVSGLSEYGGSAQAESPECTPASSTCSMTPPMITSPVTSRMASTSTSVASSRNRSIEHRPLGGQAALLAEAAEAGELVHGPLEALVVVDDLHGPTAEHVARAHQHRVADLLDDLLRLLEGGGGAAGRLRDLEAGAQGVPALAVLGQVDRLR